MSRHLCLLLVLSALALPAQAAPLIIKFSHVVAPDTPKGRAALKFKDLAEKMTRGKVRVQVYPNSLLYKDREELEALQINAVQMLAPSLSKFGPLGLREFELFDLPYLFPDEQVLHRVMDGPIGQRLLQRLESKGLLGLAYWDNGFKHFSANRPLHKLEDFKGLRMRIQPSQVLAAQMRALGAQPQPMGFAEVYGALERGVVDGTENPESNFFSQQMDRVQSHLTLSQHGYLGYVVVVNLRVWRGLPDDIRLTLEEALRLATVFERQIAREDNRQALARVRAAGRTQVHILPQAERERLRQQMLPVHRAFMPVIGRDLIEGSYRAAAESAPPP